MALETTQRSPSFLSTLLVTTGLSSLYYPVIRMQSLVQTQLAYTHINPELQLQGLAKNGCLAMKDSMKSLFRGVSFFASYQTLKTSVFWAYSKTFTSGNLFESNMTNYFHSAVATLLASGVAYPFELMQNRSASALNSANPNQVLNFKEMLGTYTHASNWTGYPLLYARYLILNTSLYLHFAGYNGFPLLMGLITIPMDVIRRNCIVKQWELGALPYKNGIESAKWFVQTHGYKSLYRGFILYPEIYLVYFVIGSNAPKGSRQHKEQH